jgi:hypothetical protein
LLISNDFGDDFLHWSFDYYGNISIVSVLHYIPKFYPQPFRSSIFIKNSKFTNLTKFIIGEISLTYFSGLMSSSDGKPYTRRSFYTIQYFLSVYALTSSHTLFFFVCKNHLYKIPSQTHYIQTTYDKCTKILFSVSSSTRVIGLDSLRGLFS